MGRRKGKPGRRVRATGERRANQGPPVFIEAREVALAREIAADIERTKRDRAEVLKKVLAGDGVQDALDHLARKCADRPGEPPICAFLESYLAEPVARTEASEDASSRKMDWNLAKQFASSLAKTQKLSARFSRMSGEPMVRLNGALSDAASRVRPWAQNPRPELHFTPRQLQQLRLLEYIRRHTHSWHCPEVATLLVATYTARGVPEAEHPTEESLSYLVKKFRENREKHRKGRLKGR